MVGISDVLSKGMVICYSTPNYKELTDICLQSLSDIHVRCINHMLDSPMSALSEAGFGTPFWHLCVRNKMVHLLNVLYNHERLRTIKYFIFCDCDVVFLKENVSEWSNLERYIVETDMDIFFMREGTSEQVNTGMFIIKNNENIPKNISFFESVVQKLDTCNTDDFPYGDQSVINSMLSSIDYGFIPNEYVIWGRQINDPNKSLFHHAVCASHVYDKICQINEIQCKLVRAKAPFS